MKLTKKLSTRQFIVSHLLIFAASLFFLFSLHYVLNIQYEQTQNRFEAGPVTSKPKSFILNLDQPSDDSLIFSSSLLLSGKTAPNLEVLISINEEHLMIEAKPDGTFSQTLTLDEGVNNITVTSFDQTGDSRVTARTVYYSKEKI